MTLILGTQMKPATQRAALARFTHRFTRDHVPAWARKPMPNGKAYPVQFESDAEWLANTLFDVRKDGKLSARTGYCQSSPTWPDSPELRKARIA